MSNRVTCYYASASYQIYIIHLPVFVAVAFYTFRLTSNVVLQVILIITVCFILTVAVYDILKRIPVIRFFFGIRENR